jgi:hypothetical protein
MTPLALLITAVTLILAVNDWRKGLLAVLLIGVLQDVLRKLTPGVPSFYILWSFAVYVAVVMVVVMRGALPDYRIIFLGDPKVRQAWVLFFVLIAVQLVNGFIRFGSPVVPIFGAIFYLGPVLALLVGAALLNQEWRIRQFLFTYVVIFVPVCLTVYLSPQFEDAWPVLREIGSFVGQDLIIYDVGTILQSYSGLLRAGETAAWHAATASMFLATLAFTTKSNLRRVIYVILIASLIGVIIMTGRRKMLMALSIFFTVQWVLLARFRYGFGKIAVILIIAGTVASFSFGTIEPESESRLYMQRGSSVFGDSTTRFGTSLDLMKSAFYRSGGVGLGAGAASQGIQYAGVNVSKTVGGSGESGLGKLMVELGVAGVLIVLTLLVLVGVRIIKNLQQVARMSGLHLVHQVSFIAFIFANLMTFTVATQLYGDFFILILLGTVAGFIFQINQKARQFEFYVKSRRMADQAAVAAPKRI